MKVKPNFPGFAFGKTITGSSLFDNIGSPSNKTNRFLLYSCFSFLFLGFRLWLIHTYGNATPFWDQWDAEAINLYKPFKDGTLTPAHLFAPHNEHHIFVPRLLALTLFWFNKGWNPLLQMVVNAGLYLIFLLLLNGFLSKSVGRYHLPSLLIFSLFLFSLPFGWENILAGFQSAFYLAFLFSICSIWLIITSAPLSIRWCIGLACGILAFLSLASGSFSFAATALIGLIFYITNLRKSKKQLIASAILAILFIGCTLLTPRLEHQEVLKAHSFSDFYNAAKVVFGWPIGWNLLSVIIRNLPVVLFTLYMLKKRPAPADTKWFLLAFSAWGVAQALSISYMRAAGPLAPRYKDLYTILAFINFACLLPLVQTYITRWPGYVRIALVAWIGIIIISTGNNGNKYLWGELKDKHEMDLRSEKNTAAFIATGDIHYLTDAPPQSIPYPDPQRLADIIQQPGMKEILPANISHPLKPSAGPLDRLTNRMLNSTYVLMITGIVLMIVLISLGVIGFGQSNNNKTTPA